MSLKSSYDYIVVGGGLAGLLLGWELKKLNKSFVIFSNDQPASSSVAAGTWNPVAFRQMIPTWRAQEMIDKMLEVYPEIEAVLGTQLLTMIDVEKVLANDQEIDFWKTQAVTDISKDFLKGDPHIINIKGEERYAGIVKQTGRLDLPEFVTLLRKYFADLGLLVNEDFDYDSINIQGESVSYKDIQTDKILFAEGTYTSNNPYFNWLPFKSTKGDVLTIKSADLKVDKIRKKNIFILPIGNDVYKVGATYDWEDKSWEPSEKGKTEILEKFEKISDCTYEIIDHKAGIRPASHDRRPFIGEHPTHKNLLIFNGLGSKGVFLGPLLAQEFCSFLIGGGEIHPEVSIIRCFKKYWKEA